MKNWLVGIFALVITVVFSSQSDASIIAVVTGNDNEARHYLENVEGVSSSDLNLIAKDDADNGEGLDEGIVSDWMFDGGNDRSGEWSFESSNDSPKYWWIKFGQLVAIYSYMGPSGSTWSDSYNLNDDVWDSSDMALKIAIMDEDGGILFAKGEVSSHNGHYGSINAKADTSHVYVAGSRGAVPEPASIVCWSMLTLGGVFCVRRRKRV